AGEQLLQKAREVADRIEERVWTALGEHPALSAPHRRHGAVWAASRPPGRHGQGGGTSGASSPGASRVPAEGGLLDGRRETTFRTASRAERLLVAAPHPRVPGGGAPRP